MLVGETPFIASNTPAMLMKHVSERPRPIAERRRGVPSGLTRTIERALAKRREDRWPDAGAFRDALSATAMPPAPAPAPGEWQAARRGSPPPYAAPAPSPSWPAPPPAPVPPERRWPSPDELARERGGAEPAHRSSRRDGTNRRHKHVPEEERPVEERVKLFRQRLVGYGATSGFLFVVNMLTSPWFPWFLFPAVGMGVDVARQWGSLWADGLSPKQIFGGTPLPERHRRLSSGDAADEAAAAVTPEILAGPHGAGVRRAIEHRMQILRAIDSLPAEDRALLPEIGPTVDALVARAVSLASVLHRLDADCSPELLTRIDARIAEVEAEEESAVDHERRLTLLQRQRSTVRDLLERRAKMAAQAESVGMTLETLKLDLAKLRSSGVRAALDDLSNATQEARALSRELGHVLEAAREVRGL
jgi:serine/threonine-protein kinase